MDERVAMRSVRSIGLLLGLAACRISVNVPPSAKGAAQSAPSPAPLHSPAVPGHASPPAAAPTAARLPAAPAPPRQVTQLTSEELERKRAEWQEHLRMTEQVEVETRARERSRGTSTPHPVPHVGAEPSRPAAVQPDPAASALRAWYRRYSTRSAGVSIALSQFGLSLAANPPDATRLRSACRSLHETSAAMLSDRQALAAPLEAVTRALSTAYGELNATADACLEGRPEEQAPHLAAARRAMAEAGAALRPFHLAP
jgi:hypothetical protein